MEKTRLIALTGGIGSGKSTALNILKETGFFTVSCDELTKELYSSPAFLRKLKMVFPFAVRGFIKPVVDKGALSEKVFGDKTQLEKLNALIHPTVLKNAMKKAEKSGAKYAFIEVPLLFEYGYEKLFDGVIVIMRDKEQRIKSVVERSGLTREQVESRMNNQIDYSSFNFGTAKIVNNPSDEVFLKKQLLNALTELGVKPN